MKVVQINATCGVGSTGKIAVGISELLNEQNIENYILYSSRTNGYPLGIACSDGRYIRIQALKSRILGNYGFNSRNATRKMIDELKRIQPDIVHLHNIHGHDCDLELLFSYFRKKQTKLVWTFHDCWAFTAYCPHFTMMRCDKWKTQCSDCVQCRDFSWLLDRSKELFEKKRRLFRGLDLTIVTPSRWLADLVKESFLKDYPVKVIHNGIDLSVFKPSISDFREQYGLNGKKIILGVAFGWGARKGLDVFIELAKRLPEDYQIVLVGTDAQVDKLLPENIISIHRTQNQQELAQIYSAADLFVNPTREEVLGMTNIEANACGTPALTFQTGGSPECIDTSSGIVVEHENVSVMLDMIRYICETRPFPSDACRERAMRFDKLERFNEYVRIYETISSN
jgi:glycosyltransferase involved in cell wall biosynthesis